MRSWKCRTTLRLAPWTCSPPRWQAELAAIPEGGTSMSDMGRREFVAIRLDRRANQSHDLPGLDVSTPVLVRADEVIE
jgi:hypothetical protein